MQTRVSLALLLVAALAACGGQSRYDESGQEVDDGSVAGDVALALGWFALEVFFVSIDVHQELSKGQFKRTCR